MLLVAFFAAYLVDKRELLSQGRMRIGRWFVPSLRDLGPLLLAWGMALLVLGYEQDVGTSLLFFGVFAAMLYMATRRGAYLVGTLILLVIGSVFAYHTFGHVQVRVDTWLEPVEDAAGDRIPDHPGAVRVRLGRHRRDRARAREPEPHSERGDRLRVRGDR